MEKSIRQAAIPATAVIAFQGDRCPDGWSIVTNAEGSAIVGATTSAHYSPDTYSQFFTPDKSGGKTASHPYSKGYNPGYTDYVYVSAPTKKQAAGKATKNTSKRKPAAQTAWYNTGDAYTPAGRPTKSKDSYTLAEGDYNTPIDYSTPFYVAGVTSSVAPTYFPLFYCKQKASPRPPPQDQAGAVLNTAK